LLGYRIEERRRQRELIGYLAVLFAAILFGPIFSLAKVPLATINSLVLSAIAYTIAGL
jgi:hypothetical protein